MPGIAISAVPRSVSPRLLPPSDLDDRAEEDRADRRAEQGADDALPEAVGQEDGEVPEGDAHREPDDQCHRPSDVPPVLAALLAPFAALARCARGAPPTAGSAAAGSPLQDGSAPSPSGAGSAVATALAVGCGSRSAASASSQLRRRLSASSPSLASSTSSAKAGTLPSSRGDPLAPAHEARLAFLPGGQHRRGDEDRRVGTGEDADHHREGEVLQGGAAEDQQRR